ncbi:glycosyltransferase family 9 protein [Herbidospora mongoliensis]|uniref:glycosyltransferase family 9 protein n=1 Tax=Herbidospora mongoliensis TaxID=688067 RepID=UPI000A85F197|nr:glycosyltransferase family 9 protein [Herbidospora mongoliensis]
MTTALVLRAQGIGHLLTAVPALRALRRSGIRIALACPPELSELAALTGVVDRLIPAYGLERILWPGLTDRNSDLPFFPEIAINLHGRGPRSTDLLADLRPRRLWAYAEEAYPPGPKWDENEHETKRWCRLVEWYGLKADPRDLLLPSPTTPSPAPGAVVIHPGGTGLSRRWPPARFAEVARAIAGEGLPVVVTGSRKERPLALLVGNQAVLPPQIVFAGRTSMRELCAIVSGARLVISSDTGVSQLATAYGTPSVTIFGAESPERWGPPKERPRHQALRNSADPTSVTTREVLSAAAAVLSEGLVRR